MTDEQYIACISEAANYESRDAYISDLSLSSIWGDADDAEIPTERIEKLGELWDACHRSVKDIAAAARMRQRKLAEHFCIPYRTVEDWCTGKRDAPIYTRLMMQECLGLFKR